MDRQSLHALQVQMHRHISATRFGFELTCGLIYIRSEQNTQIKVHICDEAKFQRKALISVRRVACYQSHGSNTVYPYPPCCPACLCTFVRWCASSSANAENGLISSRVDWNSTSLHRHSGQEHSFAKIQAEVSTSQSVAEKARDTSAGTVCGARQSVLLRLIVHS